MKRKLLVIPIVRAPLTVTITAESTVETSPTFLRTDDWSAFGDFLRTYEIGGTDFVEIEKEVQKFEPVSIYIDITDSMLQSLGFVAVKKL